MSSSAHEGSAHSRGTLFVVSAPSGTGKTTVVEQLADELPGVVVSRSYTSRPKREGERDGEDYHFITRERFEEMIRAGEFLEWADVFGNYYGTSAGETERLLAEGHDVILVIDVQGAGQVRDRGLALVSVFVLPPSYAILEQRLRGRSKDSEEAIRHRLAVARSEVTSYHEYDYVVINDSLASAVASLKAIILAERARVARIRHDADRIILSFPKRAKD